MVKCMDFWIQSAVFRTGLQLVAILMSMKVAQTSLT